jgi:hypothetical protein
MMHSHLTFYMFSFFPLFQEFELSRSLNAWFVVHFFIPILYIMNHYDIYSTIFKILRHSSTLFNYMSVDPSNWLSYCSFFDVSQLSLSQLSRHHQGQFANGSAMTLIQTESNSSHVQMWFVALLALFLGRNTSSFKDYHSFQSLLHPFPIHSRGLLMKNKALLYGIPI